MSEPQWPCRKHRSFSAAVLTGLVGITMLNSPLDVLADTATGVVSRAEASLASSAVSSIIDLADRLRSAQKMYQMIMPPGGNFTLRQPFGMVVFDPKAFPESFTSGLIGETIHDSPVYSIILAEDPISREIVIANSDGKEIAAVKPESDYNPYWFLEVQHPDVYSGLYSSKEIIKLKDSCDPSHIQITLTLLPVDFVKTYSKAVAEERAAAELINSKLKSSGGMMRYQSSGMTNLELVAIERSTNGMKLTLAYPDGYTNRVDFFTCPVLIANWWDLAVSATNVNSLTNFIQWVDVNSSAQTLRFYSAWDAEQDSDLDGISDAREKLMYHTNAYTNDTDYDGLSDSNELFSIHTDPNNNDTNKPNVWISYPATNTVEVWEP